MTSGWGTGFTGRRACRVMARLTLLVFALRALVPVGFMPDLGALGHGQVQIVLCTGDGTRSLLVDEAGRPLADQGSGKVHHAADCPFSMASAKAFLPPAPAAGLAAAPVEQGFLPPGSDQTAPTRAQGPPLGQRGPPILLG